MIFIIPAIYFNIILFIKKINKYSQFANVILSKKFKNADLEENELLVYFFTLDYKIKFYFFEIVNLILQNIFL